MNSFVQVQAAISTSLCLAVSNNLIKSFDEVLDCYGVSDSFVIQLKHCFPSVFESKRKNSSLQSEEFESNFSNLQSETSSEHDSNSNRSTPKEEHCIPKITNITKLPSYQIIPENLQELILKLNYRNAHQQRLETIERILSVVTTKTISLDTVSNLSICIAHALVEDMSMPCVNLYSDTKYLKKSPEVYCQQILCLVKLWYRLDCRLGYHIIFFMFLRTAESLVNYKKLLEIMDFDVFSRHLINDLKVAAKFDREAFHKIVLHILDFFHMDLSNNMEFLKIIVQAMSPFEVSFYLVETTNLYLYARLYFWKIFINDNPPISLIMEVIKLMNMRYDSEELSLLFCHIKNKKPSTLILEAILKIIPENIDFSDSYSQSAALYYVIVNTFHAWMCKKGASKALVLTIAFACNNMFKLAVFKSDGLRQSVQKMIKKNSNNPIFTNNMASTGVVFEVVWTRSVNSWSKGWAIL
ncbi:hypothetical protein MXB_2735 [Myxobolus squamalis]|nr:hypothetical protein MXB_2735 [Myxobolus squamalis]